MKKQLNEIKRMQYLAGILKEAMYVSNKGQLEDLDIPDGWTEFEIDSNQDIEEDIEVESYGAPMEGWDKNHYDIVNIMKTPSIDPITEEPLQSKYYVQTYIAFEGTETSELYDSLEQARIQAIKIMNEIKYNW